MTEPVEDRKVIYLGCPTGGDMTLGAAVGFHRCTRRKEHHVELLANGSSLATGNFNRLWCWALNASRKGRVDYFAMIHSDIEPGEFWLDGLIDELEAKDLDVLGVVAPIKDQRGMTSIALAHESGDPYRVKCRLTMDEVYRLPETFTSADVGAPLLINTGLWVCKFREEWARKIYFTVNDRIMLDRDGEYIPQIEPEDWFFSRLLHELGLKVGCTRKVPLLHQGRTAYPTGQPWGTNKYDHEWSEKSFLDGADWFPHEAAGWLTEAEGRKLAELAAGKVVLEVGAYAGRSTICLAQNAITVGSVDTFDGRGTAQQGDTLPLFKRNIARAGVERKVSIYRGESHEMLANLPPIYDLIFIDGGHDRESVAGDVEASLAILKSGGILVFHDYGTDHPGVTEAVDKLIADGGKMLDQTRGEFGIMAVVQPPVAVLA